MSIISNQFKYLSTIPNFHRWSWENENAQFKLEQRFSSCCSRYPGSPRNRIIQATCFRQECHLIVFSVIQCLVDRSTEIPYKIIQEKMRAIRQQSKKKRKTNSLRQVLGKSNEKQTNEDDGRNS